MAASITYAPREMSSVLTNQKTDQFDTSWQKPNRFLRRTWHAFGIGLAITLFQILLACTLTGKTNPSEAYLRLFQWDGGWYLTVVDYGYISPPILTADNFGNAAFLPGYPLCALTLKKVFHLETRHALLLTSQLACWGFWTLLLLFFRRWRVRARMAISAILAILIHPASFFLVASYSEALFLTGLLGFLYWTDKPLAIQGCLAGLFGVLMTGTRIVGFPMVVAPFCHWIISRSSSPISLKKWRNISFGALAVGLLASLGTILFFGYCHWRFGHWDLYMRTEEAGWHVHPNYWGLFSERIFHIHWPALHEGFIDPEFVSRLSAPITLGLFIALGLLEWREFQSGAGSQLRQRVVWYFCAFVMFYICACGHSTRGMSSMIRFSLCIDVTLVMACVHLFATRGAVKRSLSKLALALAASWSLFSLAFHIALTYRFVHGQWVA